MKCPDCKDGYQKNPNWNVGDSGWYEWTCNTCGGTGEMNEMKYNNSDPTKPTFEEVGEVDKKLTFTVEEMGQCFKAGCDFGRDMFNNPSSSEYVNGIILQKGNK